MKALIRFYLWLSWAMFLGGIVAWPITAITVFKDEPQGILGLSWLAIVVAGLSNVIAADIRKQQEKDRG